MLLYFASNSILNFKYDDVYKFSEGFGCVKLNGRWGFINKEGKEMTQGKITIKSDIPEQELMESLLNQYYSGQDITTILVFHAFANGWNYDKLIYYMKLFRWEE